MVAPRLRTRAVKKTQVRLPGGKLVKHYRKKQVSRAHCGNCGAILGGVPALRAMELKSVPKSARRPERAYGGTLCHACVAEKMRQAARLA